MISKEILYNEMVDYCNRRKARHIIGDMQFFKALRAYVEPWETIRVVDKLDPCTGRKRYIVLPEHEICKKLLN
jgi:hypothetical protein